MGQYYAKRMAKASMEGRIAKAKQGIPSAGKLPWGRKFDRKTNKWSVDVDKKTTSNMPPKNSSMAVRCRKSPMNSA
jgi:hypothetical protein